MNFTKKDLILTLKEIEEKININVEGYINDVMINNIPIKALKFINLYKPIDSLGVFNLIYNKKRKTPLFYNFKKGNVNDYEQVVCLGSLLTQMLCYIKTTKDDVIKHSNIIGIDNILNAISDFTTTGSFDKVNKVYLDYSKLFNELFNEKGDM